MAMNLNEEATLTLKGNTRDLQNEMTVLETKAKELKNQLKEIEKTGAGKGSEEWKKYRAELTALNTEMVKVRKETDLTKLTYGQLGNLVKQLTRDMKGLVPGTQAFVDATKRLTAAEKQFASVGTQVNKIKKESDGLGQPGIWSRIAGGVKLVGTAFSALMALQIIQFIVGGFTAIIGKFTEFEDAAQELSAITGLTGKDLDYLKEQAKKTGPQFSMTAAEMLKAYQIMAGAKPELLAQKELLAQTTNEAIILAKAGKIDLAQAAKVTAESLNQWGAKADQARRYVNVMAAGAKEGSAEIADMGNSLKAAGTVSAAAKLSFEQTNAVLQSMSTIALKGEQAGTMLRNVLVKLQTGAKETNPAIVGLDKALENLGKKQLSTAELAKMFGTENLVAAQHIIKHRGEISELTTKLTGTNTAYEQAKINQNSLSELWKKATSIVTGFAVSFGEKLAPSLRQAISFLIEVAENVEVNSGVFTTFTGIVGDLWDVFKTMIGIIFPNFNKGASTVRGTMQTVAAIFQTILVPVRLFTASLVALLEAFQAVGSGAKGLVLFLQGDFAGAGKAFDETRQHGVKIKDTFAKAFSDIGNGYKQAFADKPKEVMPAAVKASGDTAAAMESAVTKESERAVKEREKAAEKARKKAEADHQKHLEDVNRANQKALEDLAKLEAEAHIKSIQDEEQREIVKIMAKRDLAAEEIMRGLQDAKLKNAQIAALDQTMQEEISKVQADHADKRKAKALETEKARLEAQKGIIEQERQAENALLDWKELQAQGNATKLVQIQQERLAINYRATVEKLNAEEAAERAKATREIADTNLREQALSAIETRYENERLALDAKNGQEKIRLEKEVQQARQAIWGNVSNAFGALLQGDLSAFADYANKIVTGEKQAWQKRLEENQAKYAAVGAMAQQAAQFLANLAKEKADRAIAQIQRERDANVAALNDKVASEQAAIDKIESDKQRIKSESDAKIEMLRSTSEATISNLESQYRQLSSSEEKRKLADQLEGYKNSADEKTEAAKAAADDAIDAAKLEAKESIDAAQKAEAAAIKSATNEKLEKIDAAEATRDAEIAAINKRTDIDQATRKTLIEEAKNKFEQEKKQATEEADHKIDAAKLEAKTKILLATDTQKTKIELANDQRDAELKAIDAIKRGDDKAAKEILARAKQDAKDKIALAKDEAQKKIDEAEREKREKLKKVEAEKATRIANQKELNRTIEAENTRARAREADEKRKAWQAQKKADTASALITGALSVIKALASGFWPVNLVFAAMAAVMTGIQVAKINSQPMPQFRFGGIPDGPRHGSTYGSSGLAIIDRRSGREAGEMEGGEGIVSREQTQANLPLLRRMWANARTPSRRNKPVLDDRDALGRPPVGFRNGGMLDGFDQSSRMYVYGGVIPKQTPKRYDEGGEMVGDDSGGGGYADTSAEGVDQANSEYEESKKQFEKQIKALEEIKLAVVQADQNSRNALSTLSWNLGWQLSQGNAQLRSAIDSLKADLTRTMAAGDMQLVMAISRLAQKSQTDQQAVIRTLVQGFTLLQREEQAIGRAVNNQTQVVQTMSQQQTMNLWRLELSLVDRLATLDRDVVRALADQTRTLDARIQASTNTLVRAQEAATRSESLSLANLALSMSAGMLRLSDSMTEGMTRLRTTTAEKLDQSASRQEVALSNLGTLLWWAMNQLADTTQTSLDQLGDRTETILTRTSNQQAAATYTMADQVRSLRGNIGAVEGAVWANRQATQSVEGAIWNTNQQGRLDALIGAMSTFGKK